MGRGVASVALPPGAGTVWPGPWAAVSSWGLEQICLCVCFTSKNGAVPQRKLLHAACSTSMSKPQKEDHWTHIFCINNIFFHQHALNPKAVRTVRHFKPH